MINDFKNFCNDKKNFDFTTFNYFSDILTDKLKFFQNDDIFKKNEMLKKINLKYIYNLNLIFDQILNENDENIKNKLVYFNILFIFVFSTSYFNFHLTSQLNLKILNQNNNLKQSINILIAKVEKLLKYNFELANKFNDNNLNNLLNNVINNERIDNNNNNNNKVSFIDNNKDNILNINRNFKRRNSKIITLINRNGIGKIKNQLKKNNFSNFTFLNEHFNNLHHLQNELIRTHNKKTTHFVKKKNFR